MMLEKLRGLSDSDLNKRFPFMVCYDYDNNPIVDTLTGVAYNHFNRDWGWLDIQLVLAEHIRSLYLNLSEKDRRNFIITDVKEKYGTLRTSFSNCYSEAMLWTDLAEYVSSYTCIVCGATRKKYGKFCYYESQGWISPYCGDCSTKDKDKLGLNCDGFVKKLKDTHYVCKRESKYSPTYTIDVNVEQFWCLSDAE